MRENPGARCRQAEVLPGCAYGCQDSGSDGGRTVEQVTRGCTGVYRPAHQDRVPTDLRGRGPSYCDLHGIL